MTSEALKELLFANLETRTCSRCKMTVVVERTHRVYCWCRCGAFYWMEQQQAFFFQPAGIVNLMNICNYHENPVVIHVASHDA